MNSPLGIIITIVAVILIYLRYKLGVTDFYIYASVILTLSTVVWIMEMVCNTLFCDKTYK